MNILRVIERLLMCLGLLGLVAVGSAYLDSTLGKRQAIAAFNAAATSEGQPQPTDLSSRVPDQTMWSQKAKAAFAQSNHYDTVPVAVLRLGRLDLEVPVFIGTDPLDVSVLDPTDTPALTLITCYPFYYVGFAPDRYIIRAAPEITDDPI